MELGGGSEGGSRSCNSASGVPTTPPAIPIPAAAAEPGKCFPLLAFSSLLFSEEPTQPAQDSLGIGEGRKFREFRHQEATTHQWD